jgi:pimeloyl-ACP methyl ester carboxylesterase
MAGLPAGAALALVFAVINVSFALTNPPGYAYRPGRTRLPDDGSGTDPRQDLGLDFQEVSFRASDGSTLRGWLVPAASGGSLGVVTVHGRGADRRAFLPHLPMLHNLGATTLLFDLRDNGLSDGGAQRGMSMGYREAQDVSSAVQYLKSVGISRVVVLGVSLGAGSAILAAANDPAIDAVVAESPFSSMQDHVQQLTDQNLSRMRLETVVPDVIWATWWPQVVVGFTSWRVGARDLAAPIDVIGRIAPRPILLIHGTADTALVPEHSARLFERAHMPRELWLAPGAVHTRVYQAYPDEYRARLGALFDSLQPA